MSALLSTEFTALLRRAGLSQAAFARLAGVTARQVNNWARSRAPIPRWSAILALALQHVPAETLARRLETVSFTWFEVLGVEPDASEAVVRRAMSRLAQAYHPDKGGDHASMVRLNAAYAARRTKSKYV